MAKESHVVLLEGEPERPQGVLECTRLLGACKYLVPRCRKYFVLPSTLSGPALIIRGTAGNDDSAVPSVVGEGRNYDRRYNACVMNNAIHLRSIYTRIANRDFRVFSFLEADSRSM
jgi:hypothetical protein